MRRLAWIGVLALSCGGDELPDDRDRGRGEAVARSLLRFPGLTTIDLASAGDVPGRSFPRRRGTAGGALRVELPARSGDAMTLLDPDSGVSLSASLMGTGNVAAQLVEADTAWGQRAAVRVYVDALQAGAHLTQLQRASGIEDLLLLERPGVSELRYSIEPGAAAAGLRLTERTLEVVDASGAPRLRVAPPWLAGADGMRRPADLRLEGCAFDTSSAPPWGRAPVAPGAPRCTMIVAWSDEGLVFPVLVDPLWTKTADMANDRADHQAVLLQDGRVLVAGGTDNWTIGADDLTSSEVYDPATDTWAAVGAMSVARVRAAAVRLGDGRVLIAGGEGASYNDPSLASAEIYQPATGTWVAAPSMAEGRRDHQLTLLASGRALVSGGSSLSLAPSIKIVYSNTAEEFDPANPGWTSAGSFTGPRADHTATRLTDGRVLVAGGEANTSPFTYQECALYDPASKTWSATGNMVDEHAYHTATLLDDGRVMVTGSYGFNTWLGITELFDPVAGTWSSADDLAPGRGWHTAALLDNGHVLVAGGEIQDGFTTKDAALFSPADGSWSTVQPLAVWRYLHTSTKLDDGRVLIAGGNYLDPVVGVYSLADTEIFSPLSPAEFCASDGECVSGFCADGVCCDAACDGPCVACVASIKGSGADGQCGPIAADTDPDGECADDGAPACDNDGRCDGAGACQKYSGPGCSGKPCRADEECSSGHCVAEDGICCTSACEGGCQSCRASKKGEGSDGQCGPIAKGTDPDHECMSASLTDCDAIALCDGVASCVVSTSICEPYTCLDETSCKKSCNGDDDCAEGFRCDEATNDCVPREAGCEGSVAVTPDGEQIQCDPYKCQADGSCRTSCSSAEDCVDPFVCDPSGRCVAIANAGESDEGCGCRVPGAPIEGGRLATAWALLAWAGWRRRSQDRRAPRQWRRRAA